MATTLDKPESQRTRRYAWRFWTFNWESPMAGEHQIRSRAFDVDGNMQPVPTEPVIASRRTFWENNALIARRILIR